MAFIIRKQVLLLPDKGAVNPEEVEILRIYETLLVIDPSLDVENTDKVVDGVKSLIEKLGGKVTDIEKWGKRKLAYPINHHETGFYTLILFSFGGEAVKELDRVIKISDEIIRHIIVRRFDKEK